MFKLFILAISLLVFACEQVVNPEDLDGLTIEEELSSSISSSSSISVSISSDEVTSSVIEVSSSSEVVSSSSRSIEGTFTDSRDNKSYEYVTIGTQVWMAENLAYLPQVDAAADGSEDDGRESESFYYVYDFQPTGDDEPSQVTKAQATANYQTYGVLYNWNAAMGRVASSSTTFLYDWVVAITGTDSDTATPSDFQGVCPSGWHLPTDAEWTTLSKYVGNNNGTEEIAVSLKSSSGWENNTNGSNQFGISTLPSGYRFSVPEFDSLGTQGFWWSATLENDSSAWIRDLNDTSNFDKSFKHRDYGLSVRCIQS